MIDSNGPPVIRPGTMDRFVFQEMADDVYHALQYVRPGDTVLDIGANVGAFALHVKSHIPSAKIICVEPILSNCEILRRNVGNRAVVEPLALSAAAGTLTMYDFGEAASACHSMFTVAAIDAQPVQVRTETLEGLLAKHRLDHVRFLKMDCQGAEFEIIPSTTHETLARIACIAMEVHASIWAWGRPIGDIPRANSRMKHLYHHLIVTHVPVHGSLYRGGVEVWLNRSELSNEALRSSQRTYLFANAFRPILFPALRGVKRAARRLGHRLHGENPGAL